MSLPFFFAESIAEPGREMMLDEETSKHIVQVLRMQQGEQLRLTDGKGNSAIASITEPHKKHSAVNIISSLFIPAQEKTFTIAISLIKNPSRFEWFLEKAAELGVSEIIPLICERTEKQNARFDRFINISKSAMLQSAQSWMTIIHQPAKFYDVVSSSTSPQKFIAHCEESEKQSLLSVLNNTPGSQIILIGPEGDFSPAEIALAKENNFQPVSLGNNRLRTETAGLYAAVLQSR